MKLVDFFNSTTPHQGDKQVYLQGTKQAFSILSDFLTDVDELSFHELKEAKIHFVSGLYAWDVTFKFVDGTVEHLIKEHSGYKRYTVAQTNLFEKGILDALHSFYDLDFNAFGIKLYKNNSDKWELTALYPRTKF